MINKEHFFVALSHCVFVEGYSRGLICDLQRQAFYIIPKDLALIALKFNGKRIKLIYEEYGEDNRETLDQYFTFLLENDYVFLSEHRQDTLRFPQLNLLNKRYESIENAIIDVDPDSDFDVLQVIDELIELNCKYLQIRYFKGIAEKEFLCILHHIDETELVNIEFIFPFYGGCADTDFEKLFLLNQRLGTIIIYNCSFTELRCYHAGLFKVYYTGENINGHAHCGNVHPSYFMSTASLYVDSKTSNSCLSKKISVDAKGYIKNCPGMDGSFGNIKNTTIKEALRKEGFTKYWDISKDQINICRDCEFRYVCTDCRAYLQNPQDHFSKPLKCGYDPYTNTWQDWTINPLSKNAIEYYDLHNLGKVEIK